MLDIASTPGQLGGPQNHAKTLIFIDFFAVSGFVKMRFSGYNISYFKPAPVGALFKYQNPRNDEITERATGKFLHPLPGELAGQGARDFKTDGRADCTGKVY